MSRKTWTGKAFLFVKLVQPFAQAIAGHLSIVILMFIYSHARKKTNDRQNG
jgi:hypothetical protein